VAASIDAITRKCTAAATLHILQQTLSDSRREMLQQPNGGQTHRGSTEALAMKEGLKLLSCLFPLSLSQTAHPVVIGHHRNSTKRRCRSGTLSVK